MLEHSGPVMGLLYLYLYLYLYSRFTVLSREGMGTRLVRESTNIFSLSLCDMLLGFNQTIQKLNDMRSEMSS